MHEQWQIKRTMKRIEFLKSFGLEAFDKNETESYGKIQTDGGNIFLKAYRVGIFPDEQTHRIELLYNQYGDTISAIDPERLEIVLEFRQFLDEKKVPYEEAPERKEALAILLEDRDFLSDLITKLNDAQK